MKKKKRKFFYRLFSLCILFTMCASYSCFGYKVPRNEILSKNSNRVLSPNSSQSATLTITHAFYNIEERIVQFEFKLTCFSDITIRTPSLNLFNFDIISSDNKSWHYPGMVQDAFGTYNFNAGNYEYSTNLSLYSLPTAEESYIPEYFDIVVGTNSKNPISDQCRIVRAENYSYTKELSLSNVFSIFLIKNWFFITLFAVEIVVLISLFVTINKRKTS